MKKLFVLLLFLVVVTMSFSSCAPIFWGDPYGPHYHHYHHPRYEYYPYDRW